MIPSLTIVSQKRLRDPQIPQAIVIALGCPQEPNVKVLLKRHHTHWP